ncbi:MAG: COG1355, Predicted dioxygenase [uncultured Acidimicrobiales bacterium]|uniref:MEMO1 family protein AVDCRST_MAG76-3357 n=1 Tax=uncultured Acidimicrobiales bacterium TaxID=310071 RepID=A0A6J4J578_9ACTN|nr:MAG: COG1355, Predicted dioxygenase [uncultured Acidimicrobiales bacterium]
MAHELLIRPPAVAGTFYPAEAEALVDALRTPLSAAQAPPPGTAVPKALVVPHAGYVYSGSIAASAYLRLIPVRSVIRRVVLLGPSHRVPLEGIAVPGSDAFATPLGQVPVADDARTAVLALPNVSIDDTAHAAEHSLEVQLPFLQVLLETFEVLPLAVGRTRPEDVADVLDVVWGGPETIVLASTDLSHYQGYSEARVRDGRTAAAIAALEPEAIGDGDACGAYALRGLLSAARARQLTVEQIDLRSSGDTAGDRERVVGYGAFAIA